MSWHYQMAKYNEARVTVNIGQESGGGEVLFGPSRKSLLVSLIP